MIWSNFLHIYQPAEQQPDILEAVAVQSYRPILGGVLKDKSIRLTFNITGSLLELFDKYGYRDLLDILRALSVEGRVEFTGSAKYHALLPFLKEEEIVRQININNEAGKFYLGNTFNPKGFFPPEMAYKEGLAPIIESLGFEWMILDEIAFCGEPGKVDFTKKYKIKDSNLNVFFRDRRLSNLIMSAIVRSGDSLAEVIKDDINSGRYVVTAMDGETFGHHRPGLDKAFFEFFKVKGVDWLTISELSEKLTGAVEIEPVTSTWASSSEDIKKGIQFLSWDDPENEIHRWQWELVNLALRIVDSTDKRSGNYPVLRAKMDRALASDHFWWASAKPWWSLEMIESGAYCNLDIVRSAENTSVDDLEKARTLYEKIVSTAFQWKRSGKIYEMMNERKNILRIPFKERTFEKGGKERGVYEAFLAMFKDLEKEAAQNGEYEKAILWRDAVYKLENKSDIYDTIHAIELLRLHIPHDVVEKTLDKYTAKYDEIRGGQPEQRGA
ncbi:MAG: hypothetical protein ABR875_01775 [Minisyncoccia bacterium]